MGSRGETLPRDKFRILHNDPDESPAFSRKMPETRYHLLYIHLYLTQFLTPDLFPIYN